VHSIHESVAEEERAVVKNWTFAGDGDVVNDINECTVEGNGVVINDTTTQMNQLQKEMVML